MKSVKMFCNKKSYNLFARMMERITNEGIAGVGPVLGVVCFIPIKIVHFTAFWLELFIASLWCSWSEINGMEKIFQLNGSPWTKNNIISKRTSNSVIVLARRLLEKLCDRLTKQAKRYERD